MAERSGTPAVRPAGIEDLDALAGLFDLYRRFYEKASDLEGARRFLAGRLEAGESVLFLAEQDGLARGFTQLYPSFSSTRMSRTYVLNDLFVAAEARGRGMARALMAEAERFARSSGAALMQLSTARNNGTAQALYRSLGWTQDETFITFYRTLD